MACRKPLVGVIGLGIIGSQVAGNLRAAGFDVWVWNRSPRQEPNFVGSAMEVAETADTIQIFVSDGPALIATVEAMAPVLASRHVVLNHATVSPAEVNTASEIVNKCGAGFLNAPFTGSRLAAGAGDLVYYVGGDTALLARVQPILQASSREILHVGEIGQASLVKIATNLVSAATVQALAEAMALLDRAGVPLDTFVKATELNAMSSAVSKAKLPIMVTGEFEPHFALKHMLKDVELGLAEAKTFGVLLPACGAVAASMQDAAKAGWSDMDFSVVAKHYPYPGKVTQLENATRSTEGSGPAIPEPRKSIFPLFGKRS